MTPTVRILEGGVERGRLTITTTQPGGGMAIPAPVPPQQRWVYYAVNYGDLAAQCAYTIGPQANAMQGNENLMGRSFWWCDALGGASGGAPFNPLAKTPSGAASATGDAITATGRWKSEVLDVLNGSSPDVDHPTLVQPNILGIRSADDTWPGGAAMMAWTPGGPNGTAITQYVEDCVKRWADLMLNVPYAIPYRLWHEMGNASTTYGDTQMRANNWANFKQVWQKLVGYLRTLGVCTDDATGKPDFMRTKAFINWCPAAHAGNPGSDVEKFPGTKYVHIISRDLYNHTGENFHDAGQAWYTEFKPGTGPSNAAGRPLIVSEAGQDTSDAEFQAKTQEMFDRLTGKHAEPWDKISAWLWWNASRQGIPASGATTTLLKQQLATPYFIPNGIATEPIA